MESVPAAGLLLATHLSVTGCHTPDNNSQLQNYHNTVSDYLSLTRA